MERFRCMCRDWQSNGYCYQQDPAILYVYFPAHLRISYHYLYGPRFLAKYAQVYLGGKKKSLVLFIRESLRFSV